MSDDKYTPTTEQVRADWARMNVPAVVTDERRAEILARFDRFLAAIRAEQREEVCEQCPNGPHDAGDHNPAEHDPAVFIPNEQAIYNAVERVIVNDRHVLNLGLSDDVTDAVLALFPAIRAAGEQPGTETKALDPQPYLYSDGTTAHRDYFLAHPDEGGIFAPASGYSTDPADYILPSDPEQKAGK